MFSVGCRAIVETDMATFCPCWIQRMNPLTVRYLSRRGWYTEVVAGKILRIQELTPVQDPLACTMGGN